MQSNQSNALIGVNSYGQTTGTTQSSPFITVFQTVDPTPYNYNYPIKQRWLNTTTASEFVLISFNNASGTTLAEWLQITSETDAVLSVTGDDGKQVSPISGTIQTIGNTVANSTFSKALYTNNPSSNIEQFNIQL